MHHPSQAWNPDSLLFLYLRTCNDWCTSRLTPMEPLNLNLHNTCLVTRNNIINECKCYFIFDNICPYNHIKFQNFIFQEKIQICNGIPTSDLQISNLALYNLSYPGSIDEINPMQGFICDSAIISQTNLL